MGVREKRKKKREWDESLTRFANKILLSDILVQGLKV